MNHGLLLQFCIVAESRSVGKPELHKDSERHGQRCQIAPIPLMVGQAVGVCQAPHWAVYYE